VFECSVARLRPRTIRSYEYWILPCIKQRQGILVLPPVSVGLLITTLLARGVPIPERVEVMVIGSYPESVCIHPPLAHYPFPVAAFVKAITIAAARCFETGSLPGLRKVVPMKLVTATGADA
jgi:hypothetical protein